MTPRTRRGLLAAAAVVVLLLGVLARPAFHLATTALRDADTRTPPPAGFADDASGLSRTPVAETVPVDPDPARAEAQVVGLLRRAREQGLAVSIAGARHSMGGHTVSPGGVVLDMRPFRRISFDPSTQRVTCGAGATWAEVLAALNPLGRSPDVMQSFSNFTVGGSVSVNAHGWQHRRPPLVASVASMRVVTADGRVRRCSRTEEPELFSLVAGGYGLFGVILEAELRTVPNCRYRVQRESVPAARLEEAFAARAAPAEVAMAYARIDVSKGRFLEDAILNLFHEVPLGPGEAPPLSEARLASLRRAVFRGTVGSEYGKDLRSDLERQVEEHLAVSLLTRNQLLDDDWTVYENRDASRTEVLQEYFLPKGRLAGFLDEARRLVPAAAGADLLNVTVRWTREDGDSFLRWADRDMACVVFLFHHARTADADAAMEPLTRGLVDAALRAGGRYYLPYRLQATPEQFHAAYPRAREFFARKRALDPTGVFQNLWFRKYGGGRLGRPTATAGRGAPP
jgi:FAD/FMN-containing dehydrogenase